MASSLDQAAGRFCWVDLAASDSGQAQAFYGRLFAWTAREDRANGGIFTRLKLGGREVGSVYQLQPAHLERGVPSMTRESARSRVGCGRTSIATYRSSGWPGAPA